MFNREIWGFCLLGIVLVLLTSCIVANNDEEVIGELEKSSENIGVPIPIDDPNCSGFSYKVTYNNGETLWYCLPENAITAEEFVIAYNNIASEKASATLNLTDPTDLYRGTEDVYQDIAIKMNKYNVVDAVHYVFIFAEFINNKDDEVKLRDVMFNSIQAHDMSLESKEVEDIVERLLAEGIKARTHIAFDYKDNFYRMEIDELKAVAVSIRSNLFTKAY